MKLDQEYCNARAAYCKVVSKVVDHWVQIKSKALSDTFLKAVIKNAGIPEPYSSDDFEDLIGETVEGFISKLFSDEKIARYRIVIEDVENRAPTPLQITSGVGNATWRDMQFYIHETLEKYVVNLAVKYLPDSDLVKQELLLTQANYHRIYTLVENSTPETLHAVIIETEERKEPVLPSPKL